ncbi:MAG: hypothetical protein ACRYFU_17545, partial [Janthinobacterium lividum]
FWRSTEDTAIASSITRHPLLWGNWERGQAYYQEGELMWLDADTLIRTLTNGAKSLTDFQRIFLGKGGDTGPLIVTYDRKELIHDLNEVVKYDWASFLHQRIDLPTEHTDLEGIKRSGYELVYTETPSPSERMLAGGPRGGVGANVWYSLGMRTSPDGTVRDVRWNSPADKAKLGPGYKILGINGNSFSGDALRQAVEDSKGNDKPIRLIVQMESDVQEVILDWHEGMRYPALKRVDGTPDLLDEITKPLVPQSAK